MRWLRLSILVLVFAGAIPGEAAAPAKIIKVLPHLLDEQGRHTLSPSLYERDAYQAYLRKNPAKCSGLRFDIQWKAKQKNPTDPKLRIEFRGGKEAKPFVLEQTVKRRSGASRWSSLTLSGDDFKRTGDLVAWRATLWSGEQLLAEQKSFLW
jgi:hypothetical protein